MGVVERSAPGRPEWASLQADHLARYFFASEHVRGKRVLDAGCGFGYGSALLRSSGAVEVVGVDIAADIIAQASKEYGREGLTFIKDDCHTLTQISGNFDVICNFENLEHLERPELFLNRALSLLAEDGVLLVSSPDRSATQPFVNGKPANPFHQNEWYRDDFRSLLKSIFPIVDVKRQVQTYAAQERQVALESLRRHLKWSNPITWYCNRLMYGISGRWPLGQFFGLTAPSLGDFPIVSEDVAPLMGKSVVLLGTCSKPARAQ